MLFNSFAFVVFLSVVLLGYALLSHRSQNRFLLIASCFFYACWDWRFLALLLFSTSTDFFCASRMQVLHELQAPPAMRRKYLLLSLITNLGLLGFFKYFNFFLDSYWGLVRVFGFAVSHRTLNIILPIGISFYTFQALSYTIDVYRGKLHSTKSFLDFLLAVIYFPHLVAGPIQRAENLLPQVTHPREVTLEKIKDGIHLICWGYFKKMCIADNLAPLVAQTFSENNASGFHVLMATYAFAFQIYCDFSGYTDIARGVAKLMGFEFMLNFNLPYFSSSPAEFWHRWHISLSTWLRDYLYIPLGGGRDPAKWKVHRNLLLTMMLGGLWHGAGWNYVLWGTYHGLLLVLCRIWPSRLSMPKNQNQFMNGVLWFAKVAVTFHLVCFGWLMFRANSLAQIVAFTCALTHPFAGWDASLAWRVLFPVAPLIIVQSIQALTHKLNFLDFRWIPAEAKAFAYGVFVYCALFLGGQPQAFIYFQF